jgi:Rrf2 family transcriptional regulator, iron-sulfur cluster assembly transcription factor
MITKTTESAIVALVYVAAQPLDQPVAPKQVAEILKISSPYLSKIFSQLVRAEILYAHHGAKGGVTLARPSENITLLDVIEAIQGPIVPLHCLVENQFPLACSYHQALTDLTISASKILNSWTIKDLLKKPCPGYNETRCHFIELCKEINIKTRKSK